MAKKPEERTKRRAYWSTEITKALKRFNPFHTDGDAVVDAYRLEKADGAEVTGKDKYNILFSSTETIRPNLYAQTPMVRVVLRHKDRALPSARDAVELLNANLRYLVKEVDFDDIMENAVEDLLLPGLGTAWVRYDPTFGPQTGDDGQPMMQEDGKTPMERVTSETVAVDYVFWKDLLTGVSRGWKTVPWVGRRVWMTKEEATKRFGAEKAGKLTYGGSERRAATDDIGSEQAEIFEIWDKASKTAIWYCESYAEDVLDSQEDPLNLKDFFPCPRPMRAISNTRTFVPRSLYSQYKTQAEQLNSLTRRIRLLTEAIKVAGVYDQSLEEIKRMLNPTTGNIMIPVASWSNFAQNGGIKGSVEWLPLTDVVAALTQLLQAREVCKNEIYEITGFSDIVRGVSKASETLGAQNIKANWAGARVKKMQKEVQRFARDILAIMGEIVAEHFQPETLALYGGVDMPSDPNDPQTQVLIQRFMDACKILKSEGKRCAAVDIETDSTILADESAEREDRTKFLAAAGAFLQQAVPAMQTTPELGPLLGAMLMFTVRTFPTSAPIEEEFAKVQQAMASKGAPQQPGDQGEKHKADAAIQTAQLKSQTDVQTAQLTSQTAAQATQADTEVKHAKIASDANLEHAKLQQQAAAEANRHTEKMAELALREREVAVKERELDIARDAQDLAEAVAEHSANMAEKTHEQQVQVDKDAAAESAREALTAPAAEA